MIKKEDSSKKDKLSKLDFLIILILFFIIIDIHSFGFFGRTTFPQDSAIIFEGSQRISEGQIPYKDFTIVMGPVVFLMQSFFNLFFGTTFFSMFTHSLFLSLVICFIFYYSAIKEFNIFISLIFSIFFYISFQGLAFHPFYNHTTYFFLFLNIFLLLVYINKELPTYVFILSSILASLTFYTKQDIGSLHILLIFCYFIFNYKKQWKYIILYLVTIAFLVGGIYLLLAKTTDFEYWFNLGQYPHNSRLSNLLNPIKILEILSSWEFYISLIFLFLILFKKNNKHKSIMSLFLVISISSIINKALTGVTRQVSVITTIILIFFIFLIIKEEFNRLYKNNKILTSLILILILLLAVNPLPTYGLIVYNYFSNSISHIDEGCYKGAPILKEDLEGLNEIKRIIESNNKSFISITHYSFLYCDYEIEPPENLPAWFDEGNSFYKLNLPSIINAIIRYNPKIILVQESHNNEDPNFNEKLINIFISKGYKIEKVIEQKATQKPITILIKN